MTKRKLSAFLAVTVLGAVTAMPLARAASDSPMPAKGPAEAPPAGGSSPRSGEVWSPEKARDSILSVYQKQLGVNDEDFAAIKPSIEAIVALQWKAAGFSQVFTPAGTPATKPAASAKPTVAQAMMDLRTLLADKAARPADIKVKLDALREARAEAKTKLAKAQEDLRGLLTQRQEAEAVMSGLLP